VGVHVSDDDPRWGYAEPWDQLTIAPHTCVQVDVVDEVLVLRVWDPVDPDHEVVRVSVDSHAARKLGVQLLYGAITAEWEYTSRGLQQALSELASRAAAQPFPEEEEAPPDGAHDEPTQLYQTGGCPWCASAAITTEEQRPGETRWQARCGARWRILDADPDRVIEVQPCPTASSSGPHSRERRAAPE